jgi:hypothetical protein
MVPGGWSPGIYHQHGGGGGWCGGVGVVLPGQIGIKEYFWISVYIKYAFLDQRR